jgi:hypothetical protein
LLQSDLGLEQAQRRLVTLIAPENMETDVSELGRLLGARGIELIFLAAEQIKKHGSQAIGATELVLSTLHLSNILPFSGRLMMPPMSAGKLNQFALFSQSGIPTPESWQFRFGMSLLESPKRLVVVKPDSVATSARRSTFVLECSLLSQISPSDFAPEHPILNHPYIVQEFVSTGLHATSFRVVLFCGVPILSYKIVSKRPSPLIDSSHIHVAPEFISNNRRGFSVSLYADPQMLELAQRMSLSLNNPILCTCDLLRSDKNELYQALEVNASGWNIWPLKRDHLLRQIGRDAMIKQFHMFESISDRIVCLI